MTFISEYRMIFVLFKLEQIYNSFLCNTMVLWSTIIIVPKCHNHRLQANSAWYHEEGTQSKHNPSCYSTIYKYISSSFSFQGE